MEARVKILKNYSEWTVLSALRVGSPIRNKKEIYPLLSNIDFDSIFDTSKGDIRSNEFNLWHRKAVDTVIKSNSKVSKHYGSSAKIINIYLKTYCYVGDGGRNGIRLCLYPPIDCGLWVGVKRRFKDNKNILSYTHSTKNISAIDSYKKYIKIIEGMKSASAELGCSLIEIEQLWEGAGHA